jgi:hypothetical protein
VEAITGNGFPEWSAIAIFYRSVHLIEEMLAVRGMHAHSHRQRQEILKTNFPEMLRPFRTMFNFALQARYQFRPVMEHQVAVLQQHVDSLAQMTTLEINEGGYSG